MVDIQSATAEIRRGKKIEEEDRKKETAGQRILLTIFFLSHTFHPAPHQSAHLNPQSAYYYPPHF